MKTDGNYTSFMRRYKRIHTKHLVFMCRAYKSILWGKWETNVCVRACDWVLINSFVYFILCLIYWATHTTYTSHVRRCVCTRVHPYITNIKNIYMCVCVCVWVLINIFVFYILLNLLWAHTLTYVGAHAYRPLYNTNILCNTYTCVLSVRGVWIHIWYCLCVHVKF